MPQTLAGGDIYPALERGAIDATEWVGPYDDEKLGFHKVAKNYYYPGWWEGGPQLTFYVNQANWKALPEHYRQAFEVAAAEANQLMLAQYDAKNPPALLRLVGQGVKLHPFPKDVMLAARRATFELYEKEAKTNPDFAAIYRPWKRSATPSSSGSRLTKPPTQFQLLRKMMPFTPRPQAGEGPGERASLPPKETQPDSGATP